MTRHQLGHLHWHYSSGYSYRPGPDWAGMLVLLVLLVLLPLACHFLVIPWLRRCSARRQRSRAAQARCRARASVPRPREATDPHQWMSYRAGQPVRGWRQ